MLVCGIDEAGRGPVIGPMVMAGVLVDKARLEELKKLGVKDSKLLTAGRRKHLFDKIADVVKEFSIIIIPAWEIDAALQSDDMNLNWLEAHTSAKIINALQPDHVVVDSPSNNCLAYKGYLMRLLNSAKAEVVVEHKADVNYVQCAAASILAKVTRDEEIEKLKKQVGADFGSGYMADPLTTSFLQENFSTHPELFRRSWAPYQALVAGQKQRKLGEF